MVKNLPAMQETRFRCQDREDPLEKEWQPTLVFLPGELHGQRSLVGYSPWGCKESDTTEKLTLLLLDAAQTKQPEIVLSADQKCVQSFLPFGKLPFSCTYVWKSLSHVWLFVTPWTVACQILCPWNSPTRILEWVAIHFSRVSSQPRNEPISPTLQADSLSSEPPGKFTRCIIYAVVCCIASMVRIWTQQLFPFKKC